MIGRLTFRVQVVATVLALACMALSLKSGRTPLTETLFALALVAALAGMFLVWLKGVRS